MLLLRQLSILSQGSFITAQCRASVFYQEEIKARIPLHIFRRTLDESWKWVIRQRIIVILESCVYLSYRHGIPFAHVISRRLLTSNQEGSHCLVIPLYVNCGNTNSRFNIAQ